jgi:hypothetical protein
MKTNIKGKIKLISKTTAVVHFHIPYMAFGEMSVESQPLLGPGLPVT